jgi:hypothetical protein
MARIVVQVSLSLLMVAVLFTVPASAADALPIRDAVKNTILDAETFANQCNYKAAMAKIDEADSVSDKLPIEGAAIASAKRYIAMRTASPSAGCPQWNVRLPVLSDAFLLKVPDDDFLASCAKDTAWPSNCTRTVNLTIFSVDGRPGTNTCLTYQSGDVVDETAVERKLGDYTAETIDWLRKNPVPAGSDAQHAVMAALASLYPCKD